MQGILMEAVKLFYLAFDAISVYRSFRHLLGHRYSQTRTHRLSVTGHDIEAKQAGIAILFRLIYGLKFGGFLQALCLTKP